VNRLTSSGVVVIPSAVNWRARRDVASDVPLIRVAAATAVLRSLGLTEELQLVTPAERVRAARLNRLTSPVAVVISSAINGWASRDVATDVPGTRVAAAAAARRSRGLSEVLQLVTPVERVRAASLNRHAASGVVVIPSAVHSVTHRNRCWCWRPTPEEVTAPRPLFLLLLLLLLLVHLIDRPTIQKGDRGAP
jgi:hypothetical protein